MVLAGINGGSTVVIAFWTFVMICTIAIASRQLARRGCRWHSWVLCIVLNDVLITFLRAMTSANHHWEHEKKRLLNDTRISNLVGLHVPINFLDWLEGHEVSAFKAFGVRVASAIVGVLDRS